MPCKPAIAIHTAMVWPVYIPRHQVWIPGLCTQAAHPAARQASEAGSGGRGQAGSIWYRVGAVQVEDLSRALAVRTLQLQLEYVAGSLEDETLDIAQNTQNAGFLLFRHARSPVGLVGPCQGGVAGRAS